MKGSHHWTGNLLLLLVALVIGCLMMEIALRLASVSFPYFKQVDSVTGFSLRPGAEGWQRDEGHAYIRINRDGLRDRERAHKKPEGTLRIAVLGDSFTEALQVPLEETFWFVAETLLNDCAEQDIEVLNFGVSGFGTTQELLQLEDRVWKYEPDIVLLAFFPGNDVLNNSKELEDNDQKPYFVLRDGRLEPDFSFRETAFFRSQTSPQARFVHALINRSRLLQVANRVRTNRSRQGPQLAEEDAFIELGLHGAIFGPPPNTAWEEAWIITEQLITMMHEAVQEQGAQFIVTSIGMSIEVHPDALRREQARQKIGGDFSYPHRRIGQLGARENFTVIPLATRMREKAEASGFFLHGFANTEYGQGHWNGQGHRIAGEIIAQELCNHLR